jgi:transposase InsO family protein
MSLGTIYYDPKHPAGFSSVAKLVRSAKTNKKHVEEWLSGEDTYTLHKPVRKRFPRNPYTVTNIDDVWELGLADLNALSKYNSNYKYLLNVIDVFSRYVCSVPLKHKTGKSVGTALAKIFQDRKPNTIQSDKGTEFVNATVQQYLKHEGIEFHTTHNPDINLSAWGYLNPCSYCDVGRFFYRVFKF